ncbi:MAG: tRNA pseudouridine(55) synthase TruB [Kiloniellales bacterium]
MAVKPRGRPINGWLVLDKARGITSAEAVTRVRHLLDAAKAGHGGTLDPLATGVLPIALGEATKTVSYVMDGRKSYRFILKWGEERSTDDSEGVVTETSPRRPRRVEIEAVLPRFQGEIEQVPPAFSAVRVSGRRAYDLARKQEDFQLVPRRVMVERLALLSRDGSDEATFEVVCGKGAYMRALARDLGRALDTRAHIVVLRRTAVGPFDEGAAISLESLEALGHSAAALEQVLPVETALDDIPALALTDTEANRLRCGQAVSLLARYRRERVSQLSDGAIVCATAGGKPVALTRYQAGEIHPVRVLNL